ncbi:MAG: response regulator [Bacteroidetes bacterium]|nr:MAG: response regulator [Bacteroidota bacterium]
MNKTIFIVEDEFIVADDLKMILGKAGYSVLGISDNVNDAYKSIVEKKPSLVLLDIHLKGNLNGVELAKKLNEDGTGFVYLSANSNQKILEAAKATEPYGFLVKPFREKDLLVMLDIAFYRHENSMQAQWRIEEELQRSLYTISRQEESRSQKLLQATRALQKNIPFDAILFKLSGDDYASIADHIFLRIGFDEYQSIGIPELVNISGKKIETLHSLQKNAIPATEPILYNKVEFQKWARTETLPNLLADLFSLSSALVFAFMGTSPATKSIIFFSRTDNSFRSEHLQLLTRMHMPLLLLFETLTNPVKENQDTVKTKINEEFKDIIGNSSSLLNTLDQVMQVSPVNTSVLLLGESGTGKEKIAGCIHSLSPRKNKPFVKINCAAFPPTLIESELFGHEKGAFTNALEKRIGKFELADTGTIFLDEIGEMPLELQVKLLRVLQEKEIERVGGKQPIKIDVRIIAATNRNLQAEMANGKFRLDLYYRLNVFPITIPSLRERREDIPELAIHFATSFARKFGKTFKGISKAMMQQLLSYDFPGNIRELENLVEQSVIMNDGKSLLSLRVPLTTSVSNDAGIVANQIKTIEEIKKLQRQTEIAYITSVLRKTNGRIRGKDGAAELLDEKPTTLESRLQKLGIRKEDFQ